MEKQNNIPQFEELSDGALRRYQAYFNLRGKNDSLIKSREELIEMIKNHFNLLVIDEKRSLKHLCLLKKTKQMKKIIQFVNL